MTREENEIIAVGCARNGDSFDLRCVKDSFYRIDDTWTCITKDGKEFKIIDK